MALESRPARSIISRTAGRSSRSDGRRLERVRTWDLVNFEFIYSVDGMETFKPRILCFSPDSYWIDTLTIGLPIGGGGEGGRKEGGRSICLSNKEYPRSVVGIIIILIIRRPNGPGRVRQQVCVN